MFTLYVIGMNENNYAKPRSCDYSGEFNLSNFYLRFPKSEKHKNWQQKSSGYIFMLIIP